MAKYLNSGETVNYTPAAADAPGGTPVKLADNFYGIPYSTIKKGTTGALQIKGAFGFTAAGEIAVGAPVYLDANGKASATAASGTCLGIALTAATAAGDDVAVLLNATLAANPAAASNG